jgi:hypothetical protein
VTNVNILTEGLKISVSALGIALSALLDIYPSEPKSVHERIAYYGILKGVISLFAFSSLALAVISWVG